MSWQLSIITSNMNDRRSWVLRRYFRFIKNTMILEYVERTQFHEIV